MADHVIGVDAGNSKTVVVVAATTGRVLARQRGPGVASPLTDPTGWREGLVSLMEQARLAAGVSARRSACAVYCLANIDLPVERRFAKRELHRAGFAEFTVVQNDTFAVLWAGASRRWGIAVVAGAGINAVAVHPSGRTAHFLALGDYTGDVGVDTTSGCRPWLQRSGRAMAEDPLRSSPRRYRSTSDCASPKMWRSPYTAVPYVTRICTCWRRPSSPLLRRVTWWQPRSLLPSPTRWC
jgi:hypothetical protein